jgi:hypothetical protein
MSTKNPFGQLKVGRDVDDEEPQTIPTQTQSTSQQGTLFTQEQTKKKVRPAEKKPQEGETHDNQEGFSVVRKKVPGKFQNRTLNAEVVHADKERKPVQNKGQFDSKPARPGKRQFEKHSGTGFDKSVKKGGAGGHHTWEGPKEDVYTQRDEDCKCFF